MTDRRDFLAFAAAACLPMPMPKSAYSLFEFRNYVTQPKGRDVLIEMFEREFLDAYEAGGTRVIATFRNLDDPDRWVWIRAFADGKARGEALKNFYASAAWRSLRDPANATIGDASNALLLRPHDGNAVTDIDQRPKAGATRIPDSLIVATTHLLESCAETEFASRFAQEAVPILKKFGAAPFASFTTERAPNSFPRQPIRDKDTVFLTLTRFDSVAACDAALAAMRASPAWQPVDAGLGLLRIAPVEVLRLKPTPRSGLH